MKKRFPILIKVIILGVGVSLLSAGSALAVSFFNQAKRSEETFINNVDNSLDEVDYFFEQSKNAPSNVTDLINVKTYIKGIYDTDTERPTLNDKPFDELETYYQEKYPWIYPNSGGAIGLSQDMLIFKNAYSSLLSLITSCQLTSGSRSAFLAYYDEDNTKLVMLSDSRMNVVSESDSYYQIPGTYYTLKSTDNIIDSANEKHSGRNLAGYTTRFLDVYGAPDEESDEKIYIATVFIEYDLATVREQSLSILRNEILVLGLSSFTLIVVYAIFSYLLFVKNINKLSKASTVVIEKLANKNMNEIVDAKVKSNDEIKALADSFVEMEKAIINYIDIIRQETLDKEKINAELSVANKIQLDALPDDKFDDSNVSIRAFIKTAKEVGGDFYDYFYLDDHRLALVISDVSGKGVPASLFMMKGKELIKSALMSSASLPEALRYANNALVLNNKELLFITSFIGIINFEKQEIRYINAGHEKPYIITPNGIVKLDGESNIVLGVEEKYEFIEEKHSFNKGDCIFLFTDGLNESINDNFEEFGYQRIEDNLKDNHGLSLAKIIESVTKKLNEFVGEKEQFDDVTILTMKFNDQKLSLHYEKKDYEIITDIVDKFNESFDSSSERIKASVGIIIDELVNNLISYEKKENLIIDINFEMTKGGLKVQIISNGDEYNPFTNHKEKYLEEFHPEIKEGGFGLSIVKDLSKEYSYKYKDGHSIVNLLIGE